MFSKGDAVMASILGFRARSPERDLETDAQRQARMTELIREVASEIERERTGLERRYRNEVVDAGFLVETMENEEASDRSSARFEELTSSILRCERRLAKLSRQSGLINQLLQSVEQLIDDGCAAASPERQSRQDI
jgi:hypothetical protein